MGCQMNQADSERMEGATNMDMNETTAFFWGGASFGGLLKGGTQIEFCIMMFFLGVFNLFLVLLLPLSYLTFKTIFNVAESSKGVTQHHVLYCLGKSNPGRVQEV